MQNYESTFETSLGQEAEYEIVPEIMQENENQGYEINPAFETSNYEFPNMEFNKETGYEVPSFEVTQLEEVLVNELSSVTNEAEFGQFLTGLVKQGAGIASNFLNSPTGRNVTSYLTNVAKKTLPNIASALGSKAGNYLGGQLGNVIGRGIGGNVGAGLGKDIVGYAGQKLGAYGGGQLGTALGDKMASFIKFAKDAIQRAANSNPGAHPSVVSQQAIIEAAKRFYPFIIRRKKCICPKCGTLQREGNFESEMYQETFNPELFGELTNEGVFNPESEIQLAAELLSITNEQELDRFLGGLLKKAAGAVKSFANSGTGKMLGGLLKSVAKKALPLAGGAVGTFFGGPAGAMLGSKLGSLASGLFEVQMEGLSQEDRELEVARRFVRFAGNAATRAARYSTQYSPAAAARRSFTEAAKRYAPGILNYGGFDNDTYTTPNDRFSGNWYRQGNSIVIQGV